MLPPDGTLEYFKRKSKDVSQLHALHRRQEEALRF